MPPKRHKLASRRPKRPSRQPKRAPRGPPAGPELISVSFFLSGFSITAFSGCHQLKPKLPRLPQDEGPWTVQDGFNRSPSWPKKASGGIRDPRRP
eukprot:3764393-Pyramimonas_sp.AAC.1